MDTEIKMEWQPRIGNRLPSKAIRRASVVAAVVIVVFLLLFTVVRRYEVGYVAVLVDPLTKRVTSTGDGRSSGFFFKAPWVRQDNVHVATEALHMWSEKEGGEGAYPAVSALTKDGLTVQIDLTVRYALVPGRVVDLYRNYPAKDWEDKAMIPILRRVLRDTMERYTAIDTIARRAELGLVVLEAIDQTTAGEASLADAVVLQAADIRNIELPLGFVQAIEAKLAAEQLALAAEYNRTTILVLANASAQKEIIEAEGKAQARFIIANATAKSIEFIIEGSGVQIPDTIANTYILIEGLREISKTGRPVVIVSVGGEGAPIIYPVSP